MQGICIRANPKSGPSPKLLRRGSAEPRRTFLMGLAVLPLAATTATAAGSSDLASACEQALAQVHWIDATSTVERWDNDRLHAEMDVHDQAFRRAITEPSASLRDLRAKARLALEDFDRYSPADHRDDGEQLVAVILKEIIALVPTS